MRRWADLDERRLFKVGRTVPGDIREREFATVQRGGGVAGGSPPGKAQDQRW